MRRALTDGEAPAHVGVEPVADAVRDVAYRYCCQPIISHLSTFKKLSTSSDVPHLEGDAHRGSEQASRGRRRQLDDVGLLWTSCQLLECAPSDVNRPPQTKVHLVWGST